MRVYVRLFAVSGATFGLIIFLLKVPVLGFESAFTIGVTAGFLFGLIFSSIIYVTSCFSGSGKVSACKTVKPSASVTVNIPLSFDEAFDTVCNTLETGLKYRVTQKDIENGKINAETDMTWKSWGETIEVVLTPDSGKGTHAVFTSSSSVKLTLVDFGKNQNNIERIISALPVRVG